MPDTLAAGLDSLPQDNPFAPAHWGTPYELPPFEQIRPEHYLPAFDAALAAHEAEIATIADDPSPPRFANTVAAMERAGQALDRVAGVFYNLTGSHTNPTSRPSSGRSARSFPGTAAPST